MHNIEVTGVCGSGFGDIPVRELRSDKHADGKKRIVILKACSISGNVHDEFQ